MRTSPISLPPDLEGRGLACLERFHDVDRDPDRVDQHGVRLPQGVDNFPDPEVLVGDEESRAVRREVVADLLGVLMSQRTRLGDVDRQEGRALLADVRRLEGRYEAG